jgi:PelA/Pel-15E family pectate lyase
MKLRMLLTGLSVAALLGASAPAGVIGHNVPAEAITAARIAKLPADSRAAWTAYLTQSDAQRAADKAALAAERKGLATIPAAPAGHGHDATMPLDKDAAWYAGAEARTVADNIVSFQTPAGGWGKNQDRSGAPRAKGQAYVPDNLSAFLGEGDFDTPRDKDWNYVGTFDNNATTTELFFLARVIKALPEGQDAVYRAAFVKGLRYLLAAQFPNGGWPQVYPLEGGYHDAITYNDDAVTLAATVMTDVATNKDGEFAFVPADLRQSAEASAKKALDVILATQVKAPSGKLTLWGQQHDALTLLPCSARNFEPPLLASDESASLLVYLMSLPDPSPRLQAAIRAGAAYLKDVAVTGFVMTGKDDPKGRHLEAKQGGGPLWPRFIDPATGKGVFGDRDKTLHDDMNELTAERRNGYNFYVSSPVKALKAFESWAKAHPAP